MAEVRRISHYVHGYSNVLNAQAQGASIVIMSSVSSGGREERGAPIEIIDCAPPGDLLLICSDGLVIRAHSQILMLASTVLRQALSATLKVRQGES